MSDRFVPVRTFTYRHEAELALSALEASGIEAVIAADDAARQHVELGFVQGVTLLVSEDDLSRARDILDGEATPGA